MTIRWLRLFPAAIVAEIIPIVVLVALVAIFGPGDAAEAQDFARPENYKRLTTINVQITYEANMRGTSLEGRTSSPFLNSVIDLTTLEHRLLEKYREALERIEA